MKCPECGAWTEVLSTRDGVRRRRQCANEHRFTTVEVAIEELKRLRERLEEMEGSRDDE